jgi:DNA polymerase III subunit delta'
MEFKGILGHDRQKLMLSSLVEKDKLPHALLLAGPGGVGKRTIAVELVKNLFCENRCACGTCRGCRHMAAGAHPDFTLLSGDASIKIDELRAIRKEVYEPPFEAPLRMVLIDNAERMTREAANALLKTLEEPPPSNVFILTSSREQDIPLTVRSRCMRIGFGPLSRDMVRFHLETALRLDKTQADVLSGLACGSIATGLFWMDRENFEMRERIVDLVTGRKRGFTRVALISERIAAKGHETEYLSFLLSFLRDVWWLDQTGDVKGLVNGDLREFMGQKGSALSAWAQGSIKRVQETMRTLRYNVNRWLAIENLMIDVMRPA